MSQHHSLLVIKYIMSIIWTIIPLSSAWALDTDKYAPLRVTTETATYDRNQHIITYEGHVQAEQGSAHLDGDKVVIYQIPNSTNKIQKIIAYGNPAHYNTLPAPDKDRLYVEALKITYDPNDQTVLLEGNGRVTQSGNSFSGPHIWYDMTHGVIRSQATPGKGRTEVIIQPQQMPKGTQ